MPEKIKRQLPIIILIGVCIICVGLLLLPTKEVQKEKTKTEEIAKQEGKEEVEEPQIDLGQPDIIKQYQTEYNNPDIVAELEIPNTDIKTPIPRGTDNDFYLDHLPDKQESYLGSIFLDYRNTPDDRKIIIYGHNSPNIDTIFHGLEQYTNSDYYQTHQDIYLQTANQRYRYKIFSVYIATSNVSHVNLNLTNPEYTRHLQWIKEQSLYDTGISINNEDIIILQTCYYNPQNSYLIIAGKKVNN